MNGWVTALRGVEARLSERKGEFALFAGFLPVEAAGHWDLVVSAPWARRDDRAALSLLSDEIAISIDESDRLLLDRIVVVEPWHRDVQEINRRYPVEHGLVEITNEEVFGYIAERGFVITSLDYLRFIKRFFPANADFVPSTRDGDLYLRISWHLNDDPLRPNKRSRNILLRIPEEVLEDHLYVDDPRRHEAEQRLAEFVRARLKTFNPQHDTPANKTPPREEWRVTADLFEHETSAVG
jgi:hypothetical protein